MILPKWIEVIFIKIVYLAGLHHFLSKIVKVLNLQYPHEGNHLITSLKEIGVQWMRKYFKNLSLVRKLLLMSLCITVLVVFSTVGISMGLQKKLMQAQLTDQVVGLSQLWSSTIDSSDLEKVIELQDINDPIYKKLLQQVSLINEKNSSLLHGGIVLPKFNQHEIFVVIASRSHQEKGIDSFKYYEASDEYIEALAKVATKEDVSYSKIYKTDKGLWISAFSSIKDAKGNVVGILSIDADVSVLQSFQKKISSYLIFSYIIITILIYFIFRKGFNKVLEPVNEVMVGINEVSNGNFQIKLHGEDQSDLGLLIKQFNFMTSQLSILFERLTLTSEELGNENRRGSLLRFEEAIGEMDHIIQKTKIVKELQRAEKMNAIGQLAASVAHEIRNPMTVVKGFLQIFLAKKELSSEEHMYIKLMIDEMNRAETIINDYLSLAKPGIEQMEIVDAGELANKVMDLMNSYAMMSKNIEIKTNISNGIFVKGNRSELQQVLINILKNGIEAMKDGGVLTLNVFENELYGVFEIVDTGIGMTQEELDRLGTAFYSLKEKGTGMGLMVCYQIIDRMKGTIEVESEKGKGTTFKISIPLE